MGRLLIKKGNDSPQLFGYRGEGEDKRQKIIKGYWQLEASPLWFIAPDFKWGGKQTKCECWKWFIWTSTTTNHTRVVSNNPLITKRNRAIWVNNAEPHQDGIVVQSSFNFVSFVVSLGQDFKLSVFFKAVKSIFLLCKLPCAFIYFLSFMGPQSDPS